MKEKPADFPTQELADIIDVIRKLRNDLIKDFLDERNLSSYLCQQFRIVELPAIKTEFIKRDLKALLISPVNIELYNPIIQSYKTTGTSSLTDGDEKLFYKEIESVLKKYIF